MNRIFTNPKWTMLAVVAIVAGAMMAGYQPAHADTMLAGLAGLPFVIGDTNILEVKKIIEDQGKAWEEFKATNTALIAAKARRANRRTPLAGASMEDETEPDVREGLQATHRLRAIIGSQQAQLTLCMRRQAWLPRYAEAVGKQRRQIADRRPGGVRH